MNAVEVSVEDYAAFRAFQAREAARKRERVAGSWARWAREAGGDPANIARAYSMAVDLMGEHGVSGWELRVGHGTRQAGSVVYQYTPGTRLWDGNPGSLTLSGPLMSLWDEEGQRGTILHEIAHCKYPDDAHGGLWARECARMGIPAARCWDPGLPVAPSAWAGTCPGGHPHARAREPKNPVSCDLCTGAPVYDARYEIAWYRRSPG